MNDENKTARTHENKESVGNGKSKGWKSFLAKRWVFPTAYVAVAAIIVTLLWFNTDIKDQRNQTDDSFSQTDYRDPNHASRPATGNDESLTWPVEKMNEMKTLVPFYDSSKPEKEREAAMIEHDKTFVPHIGTDLGRKDGKTFDVMAALSGTVKVSQQTPTNGYEVELEHSNGLITVYQSLTDVKVKVGDKITQGTILGSASQNETETKQGIHVHFEVRNNGEPVNPERFILGDKK